jgi:hypothetical protein
MLARKGPILLGGNTLMKNRLMIPICLILFFCTSCFANTNNPPLSAPPATDTASETEEEPSWAQATQMYGQIYTGLNLDGTGEADDEAYVSVYSWENLYRDNPLVPAATGATVLRVQLGTGEVMAQIFPVVGDYSFYTGRLFSERKDAVILEVQVPGSNYGAADIFVLDIFGVGEADSYPSIIERLNTVTGQVKLASGEEMVSSAGRIMLVSGKELFSIGEITYGTGIVDVAGQPLQGVEIFSTGPEGKYQELHKTICWNGDGWAEANE